MKINSKIMLLIAVSLILTSGLLGLIAVIQTRNMGNEAITRLETLLQGEIDRIQLEGNQGAKEIRSEYIKHQKMRLKDQLLTVFSAINKTLKDAEEMNDTSVLDDRVKEAILLESKDSIASFIGELRYGPENKDYFWINDLEPTMIMHPYKPELNGKNLSDIKDPNGKRLFVEFSRVCREKGEGFVEYMWPKYGADKPQPKLSYVRLFPQWEWVVGTGLYMDEVETLVKNKQGEIENKVLLTQENTKKLIESTKLETKETIRNVLILIGLCTLIVFVLVIVGAFVFTQRSITRPIKRMIEGLTRSAELVTAASQQISASSQSLAEGASEQAAAIQETSSSLEEMASMTRQNANHSSEADQIMRETRNTINEANTSMAELTSSMEEINKSSDETAKIIKTIDEIAFQTNLLALNAAVEAARAGEAGAGFAVVADEVRNLAMRAAEAARNTADLIEDTTTKVRDGSELVIRTNKSFELVSNGSEKVASLVSEISAASDEQADGIEQVNKAVYEMDSVVQQNASQAEESASASQEMSAQSDKLKQIIRDMSFLVKGHGKNTHGKKLISMGATKSFPSPMKRKSLSVASEPPKVRASKRNVNRLSSPNIPKEIKAEEVIPFDNDGFEDF